MSDGHVRVDLARLSRAVEDLQGFDQAIVAQLAELEARVATLHGNWVGEAAAKHAEAHQEWQKGAQLLADGVRQLRVAAANAHDNYRTTVEANRARFV
ncbi:WXG100 family type VII secretion target [Mycolicibacterium fluoranthenivorans]|jgi:WXG100 family type VII secretion target|uniref:WXG100 family type VII secretion target n=1 Tax=Mycolicibacterium fluoranthenivorans TaxID=258505 RepID=A0A7G8PN54_9MYCO|nr:WXG100 family type VII secretion target [Mycolicibacterium fluoranthenivorans]QNJ95770.1 WXG100 family type VII secretion target [Mycolicibacterium fluoranthenivorans]